MRTLLLLSRGRVVAFGSRRPTVQNSSRIRSTFVWGKPFLRAVVELGRAWAFARRHLLRVIERAPVREISGDSGGAEGAAADRRRYAGLPWRAGGSSARRPAGSWFCRIRRWRCGPRAVRNSEPVPRSMLSEGVEGDSDRPEPNLAEAIRQRLAPLDLEQSPRQIVDAAPSFDPSIADSFLRNRTSSGAPDTGRYHW